MALAASDTGGLTVVMCSANGTTMVPAPGPLRQDGSSETDPASDTQKPRPDCLVCAAHGGDTVASCHKPWLTLPTVRATETALPPSDQTAPTAFLSRPSARGPPLSH